MVTLKGVTKVYKDKRESVKALNNIDLSFGENGLIFILGKSGCGKTTLLNILGGLDSPTEGSVWVDGKKLSEYGENDFDRYRNYKVGFVFQDYNLIDDYNVQDNIGLALELQNDKDKTSKINEVLKAVELDGYNKRKVSQLSGGQKQRVAIARGLVKNPDIILADEPTGNLDSSTSDSIYELLKKIAKTKLVVVVSHDLDGAEKYADRIIRLKDGEVQSDEIKNEVLNKATNISENTNKTIKDGNLAFLNICKMSFGNLGKRWLKMAITAILFIVTLSLFGSGVSLLTKNSSERYRETYLNAGLNNFSAVKYSSEVNRPIRFSNEDYNEMKSRLGERTTLPVYDAIYDVRGFEEIDNNKQKQSYFSAELNGIVVIDDSLPANSGLSLAYGKLPRDGKREVCLTLYSAESILKRQSEYCRQNGIAVVKDFIGHELYFEDAKGTFIVCGLIDSSVDRYYDDIKAAADSAWRENYNDTNTKYGEFRSHYLPYSLHTRLFVNKYFYRHYYSGAENYVWRLHNEYTDIHGPLGSSASFDTSRCIEGPIDGDDQIILSATAWTLYMGSESFEMADDGNYYIDITLARGINGEDYALPLRLKIKGWFSDNYEDDFCIVSENVFEKLYNREDFGISCVDIFLQDQKSDREMFDYLSNDDNIRVFDHIWQEVESVNEDIKLLLDIGGMVLAGVAIFTLLMMLNFIISTINSTKREIGILRSMGTKQGNIFAIFFIEMAMLCIISWVFSIAAMAIINNYLGSKIASQLEFIGAGSIMPVNAAAIFAMLGFSLIIAFLGTALPIFGKCKKSPIELLRQ